MRGQCFPRYCLLIPLSLHLSGFRSSKCQGVSSLAAMQLAILLSMGRIPAGMSCCAMAPCRRITH